MFFSRRLSTSDLIELSRALRDSLSSGLMLRDAMQLLATRGAPSLRRVAGHIVTDLNGGWGLQECLDKQRAAFPPLFISLTAVGEESGHLPEVMGELEKYYEMQQKLHRDFISEITWPIVQLVFAVLVVAGLIFLLGILPSVPAQGPIDPLGIGLHGPSGSAWFLAGVGAVVVALWVTFSLLRFLLRRQVWVERLLLNLPMIGPCLYAMALTRFCIALRLMLDTNLSIMKTMNLSMLATDNAVFTVAAPKVDASLRRGNPIAASLGATHIFTEKFVGIMSVAEECGRLSNTLERQAQEYESYARRRLTLLNQLASWLIWLAIAGVLMFAIFSIFNNVYLKFLNQNGGISVPGGS